MGQEFFINNQTLENKVRELLPSQGGAGAGFDLSASTQIIPIIDLTESASGSNLRQDLQSAYSVDNATVFNITNATTDIITNTGYWRAIGTSNLLSSNTSAKETSLQLFDGATTKKIWSHSIVTGGTGGLYISNNFDFIFKVNAGDTLKGNASQNCIIVGSCRQIASIDGELTNP
jgi:hypothetical protein